MHLDAALPKAGAMLSIALALALARASGFTESKPPRSEHSAQMGLQQASAAAGAMRCPNGRPYFSYHEALRPGALTLGSLFDGRGRVQPVSAAQTLSFNLGPLSGRVEPIGDNRTQLIPWAGSYYAVERLHYGGAKPSASPGGAGHWNLFLFKTRDGQSFELMKGRSPNYGLFRPEILGPSGQAYDPYVSVDYCSGEYDPAHPDSGIMFVMTFECSGIPGLPPGGGVCQSTSRDISDPDSWTRPRTVFTTSDPDRIVAGYPTTLWTGRNDHTILYAAATRELPSAAGAKETTRYVPRFVNYLNVAPSDISRAPHFLDSQSLATCARAPRSSAWDCNNRVVTDWKKEGDAYYVVYVGANYFDSVLPRSQSDLRVDLPRTDEEVRLRLRYMDFAQYRSRDLHKISQNRWAFSFARFTGSPLLESARTASFARFKIDAPIADKDFAGISSPVVNVVHGRMFIYFSDYEYDTRGHVVGMVKRSLILPK